MTFQAGPRRGREVAEGLEQTIDDPRRLKIDTAEFACAAHEPGQFIRDGLPQVVFVGRSNVGKSSLLNRLLGRRDLARTSSRPGRTRAVHYYRVNRRFYFVDLPGYGYARVAQRDRAMWAELIDGYLRSAPRALQAVLVADAKIGGSDLDREALDYLEGLGVPALVAATKVDRLSRSQRERALAVLAERLGGGRRRTIVPVSARTGEGIPVLWREMRIHLEGPRGLSKTRGTP